MELAFPLQWPNGRGRTPPHKVTFSRFDVTPGKAQQEMLWEIDRMGGKDVVISSNLRVKRDGTLYARDLDRTPDDAGVAVYFERKGQRVCFCCDRYGKLWENMRAIGKTIEAMRGIERWGSAEMLDQAFTGFTALPSPDQAKHWRSVLGIKIDGNPTKERLIDRYKELAKKRHPDTGGSAEQFQELQHAFEQAKTALGHATI